ncbi:InlB B-repeat-containing protein [Candidatus Saccharibacteria bacterium]|nr:InlB B-repeat-containing protein [Candidatus Saccharibacteria bacterium]MBR6964915.1 InlB B-repeat-containing protein [Candidatus Saccharibacteria bacterium]
MRECGGRPLKGLFRGVLLLVLLAISSLFFANGSVFAISSLSISVSSDNVDISLFPGQFKTANQTINASTTSIAGYQIKLATLGSSSALVEQSDNTRIIPTFMLPGGTTSIPVADLGDGYGYSIDGGATFSPMPEPSASPITLFNTTSAGSNEHTLTYGVKIPADTIAGTYSNTFEITVVANLEVCPAGNICYFGNGDDGTGTMDSQAADSNTDVTLRASNFSLTDHGFAGWNTERDGTGTNYGPNETITTGDLSSDGLRLYANWIQSTGNLQGWDGCDALNQGDIIALTDTRDGNTYAITKYADGRCWMMENLRLDLSSPDLEISSLNTNNPTTTFIDTINNNHPSSSNSFCADSDLPCINRVLHNTNNTNRNLTASYNVNGTPSSWYSYGNYYNWYTITAGNGTLEDSTTGITINGDICPSDWRLPTGYSKTGDFGKLDIAMGGQGVNVSGDAEGALATLRWRAYPLNFIYSGEIKAGAVANRAISASSATRNVGGNERATYNLWLKVDGVHMSSNATYKNRGQTARCVYRGSFNVNGNIHYDANGGTGTMTDETDVNFDTAAAAHNEFAKPYSAFSGWNTKANGKGVTVAENTLVTSAAESLSLTNGDTLTLYAIWKPVYILVYDGNGADAGSMSSATVSPLTTGKQQLVASNFSRSGYGFAGWSLDSNAGTKLQNGQSVKVYGPNEIVNIDTAFLTNADSVTHQLTLYAVWLPEDATHTMQSFSATECGVLSIGSTLALRDIRDNNTYTIAKLEDGNCWMVENLRLDPSTTTFDSSNTNSPTASFTANAPSSATSNTLCNTNNSACIDSIRFNSNNINRSLPASHDSNTTNQSWYGYGVMYNWYTATAGNGNYAMSTGSATGDICPSGWRLPTGGNNGEFATLNRLANNNSTNSTTGLVKFPNNIIRSGDYNHTVPEGRGVYSRYWSSTPSNNANAYRFGIASSSSSEIVTPTGAYNKWDAFAIRCVAK